MQQFRQNKTAADIHKLDICGGIWTEKSTEKINNKKTNKLLILNKFKILNKIKNKFYKYIPNNILKKYNKSENCEVISVLGAAGVGKSIFTVNLANSYIYSKKKILIIDFDVLNNSLHTILGLKKYSKIIREKLKNNNLINNKINIKELTIKITNKTYGIKNVIPPQSDTI